jgi:cobalamin biosynthesis Mg chelatase CobN
LNCFEPRVELEDLPSDYHNYESWENEELKEKKNQIIEEIRNKREEKKLSALLVKADACINDEIELKEFIRKLEKFTLEGASEYKKNAYKSQENKVDEVIGNLWDRLENLEEEVNLNFRKDEACRNFDEWLKEGEDLVLPNDCPCRELKEDIKSFTDKDLILSKQKQAFQSVVEEFKNNVKNQLSAEKFDGEYQVIDKAKDFNGVKLMREVVRVNRLVLEKKKDSEEKSWDIIEGEIDKLKSLLDSKSEINLSEVNELVEKLKEEISNARSVKNQKQEENRPNSSSPFLWLGIITMLVVSFSAILIVWIKKRKHFCSKN